MKTHLAHFIGLLRGINVSGRNQIPMPELCRLGVELGWSDVQSYIQSGNLVFSAAAKPAVLEAELQQAVERRFGLSIPVIIRTATQWSSYVKGNPFPEASAKEPNLVLLTLSKNPPKPDALNGIRERAADGEQIVQVGDALWIHFRSGVARSKLSPAFLDRMAGSSVTSRNWRTVLKLAALAGVGDSTPAPPSRAAAAPSES